ncbi:MAG TPA: putative ABC exporter domain-containing protein [Lachnospiraceae bacterium]|nr:putative ABC exporter domain-containing protein [Lachnospiraceae bacterium]
MRLFLFYVSHTFVNAIKKLFKTWVAVMIGACFLFGIVFGLGAAVVSNIVEEETEQTQEIEEDVSEEETIRTPEDVEKMNQVVLAVVSAVTIATFLFNLYCGDKSGSSIFTMPDVNFLFPSPRKPQYVLLFKTMLQMGAIFIGTLYLGFQIPNLVFNLGLSIWMALALLAAWMLILALGKLTCILVYTLVATKESLRKFVKPFVLLVAAVIMFILFYMVVINGENVFDAGIHMFTNEWFMLVPMVGWIPAIIAAAFAGNMTKLIIFTTLTMLGYVIYTYVIFRIKADFYEDAISSTVKRQEIMEASKAGLNITKKYADRQRGEELSKGKGANVFFWKEVHNRKRYAILGFFSKTSITYIFILGALGALCRFAVETEDILIVGAIMLGIIFFRSYVNPSANETRCNFLYMVPCKPFDKIAYSVLAGSYITFLDLLPGYVIACVLIGAEVISCIGWLLLIIAVDYVFSNADLFIEMLLPTSLHEALKVIFAMSIKMFAVIPMLIVLIMSYAFELEAIGLFLNVAANAIFGTLLLFITSNLIHLGRK